MTARERPVLITVSGVIDPGLADEIAAGRRPRADYWELARACDADVVDHTDAAVGRRAGAIRRILGADVALAWACFRQRQRYATVLTDGEQVGLPFAAMCWLARRRPGHAMIGHWLSPRKKVLVQRLLGLRRRVDRLFVYASAQRSFAIDALGYRPQAVTLTPFMVDTAFWSPDRIEPRAHGRAMICSVGLEQRDYPTLIDAVGGLDVDLIVAAASPWSKRRSTATSAPNVRLASFGPFDLRQVYADAAVVVVPLVESDFQAGITTILEAMSMARAVVCTRTTGQTDTIIDGVTGLYVPPGDVAALRAAVQRLLDNPAEAARMGVAARAWVCEHADIEVYSRSIAAALPS